MRVLLATDGSDTAGAAVRFVAGFPFPSGTDVKIVSVIPSVLRDHEIETLTPEQRTAFEESKSGTRIEVEELLDSEAAVLRQAGWSVTTEIGVGHPAAEIVGAAEDYDANLIVVGSHGLTGFKRFLLGSVSNQVFQSSKRSVLIVRQPEAECEGSQPELPALHGHPWRILVGYDGSEPSEKAIAFCTSLDFGDEAAIRVLTVLPMVRLFRQDIRQELNWIWQQKKETEKQSLEAAADRIREVTAGVTTALTEAGDVSHAILAAGEDFKADLIVLGHKGKGAIEKFLMGSVTPRIAQHSCRSVLAIR
ncbi:MAG: universal stress protein [Acidimicrobiia bacterium]|nr:universal stress protein [Acidimicrobiia bacterium]